MRFRNIAVTLAGSVLAIGLAAGPAFADDPPPTGNSAVTVSGQVNAPESITLTGLASFSFPATTAGDTGTKTGAEVYDVATTDPNGYTLELVPGAAFMSDTGGDQMPNSALSIAETSGIGTSQTLTGSAAVLDRESGDSASPYAYSENWSEAIPSSQPPGSYSEGFTYMALGN
ncbi:MAG TPA: hypothetical protein VME19_17665 [Streptosporangiaceae bacterium]|nr:hypothetical protein [Streptosporangiaceae bacterium]